MSVTYTGKHLFPEGVTPGIEIAECSGYMHHAARQQAIVEITMGKRVRLTRRIMTAAVDDGPGEIEGIVYGMSSGPDHCVLGLQLDDGSSVGVDVFELSMWSWEVMNP